MSDSNAVRLALDIHRVLVAGPSPDSLAVLVADSTRTVTYAVDVDVPVAIRYEFAEVRSDSLVAYPNVYRRTGASAHAHAMDALARAGFDTLRVDRAAMQGLVRRSRRARTSVPLISLLRPQNRGNALQVQPGSPASSHR